MMERIKEALYDLGAMAFILVFGFLIWLLGAEDELYEYDEGMIHGPDDTD